MEYVPEEWFANEPGGTARSESKTGVIEQRRGLREHGGGAFHAREFVRAADGELIGWSFAVEREALVEIEELFVRPSFRKRGYGRQLIRRMEEIADEHSADLKMWVPFPDASLANLQAVQKLITLVGLSLEPSCVRWAACVASTGGRGALSDGELCDLIPPASRRPRASFPNRNI